MVNESDLEAKLAALSPSHVEIVDESDGCGAKFRITIVSAAFDGKTTIACHRLVQDAIKEEMPAIHAVSIKTFTPAKWQAAQ